MGQPAEATEAAPSQPVWMDVHRQGEQLVVSVLAAWPEDIGVAVKLDLLGGSQLHTANRANLIAGQPPVILSRATIDARHPWTAKLSVTPDRGESYVIERSDRD
ncbi:MAG TPA: hypothetical protein VJM09_11800 [Sphingobium sp.]|nr:hypothetical protein [Sphingobium sp.]